MAKKLYNASVAGNKCAEYSKDMTNEEYRVELRNIFDGITDNRKLRFYYKFVSGMEKSGG